MMLGEMGIAIKATGLCRRFGTGSAAFKALTDVAIELRDDEFVVLLGRSGSGKTTLLSILGGLDRPDEGSVLVAGRQFSQLSEHDREKFLQTAVGWVFQSSGLLPLLTAQENVALPLRATGTPISEAGRRALEALTIVGLADRRDHLSSELSGGEQQRVAIARAIVKEPQVLLADEPTSQLDSETAKDILKLLREVAESGTCVLVATHDESAGEYADRVLRMADGHLLDGVPVAS